jgi:hypothetical protein
MVSGNLEIHTSDAQIRLCGSECTPAVIRQQ